MTGTGVAAFAIADGQHVYYATTGGHINQLYYQQSSNRWLSQDLFTFAPEATAAANATDISAFATSDGQHVYYQGADQHIEQLYYAPSTNHWFAQDLVQLANAACGGLSQPAYATWWVPGAQSIEFKQLNPGEYPNNFSNCYSGCGPTAWAMFYAATDAKWRARAEEGSAPSWTSQPGWFQTSVDGTGTINCQGHGATPSLKFGARLDDREQRQGANRRRRESPSGGAELSGVDHDRHSRSASPLAGGAESLRDRARAIAPSRREEQARRRRAARLRVAVVAAGDRRRKRGTRRVLVGVRDRTGRSRRQFGPRRP